MPHFAVLQCYSETFFEKKTSLFFLKVEKKNIYYYENYLYTAFAQKSLQHSLHSKMNKRFPASKGLTILKTK